ncbi:MAG: MBOAT family O-acyltransferase [Acetobacteraceae bacterium]|nr:MBOAT family O-acyltransferase [Acetobacteraceae bacterium]
MTVVDLPFLLIALATILVLRFTPLRTRRVEVLAVASLGFVASVTRSVGDAACLLAMAATGWFLMKALARHKRGWLLAGGIACVLAEFVVSRRVLPMTWDAMGPTIGLSYVMFRVIHLAVDAQGDELPAGLRLRDYVCYLFCYLTFLAGPIQRVQDFTAEAARPIRTTLRTALADDLPGLLGGTLKVTVLAGAAFTVFTWSQSPALPAALAHAVAWLSFTAWLYWSFSGYTDVVRGIGGLLDFHLPENFAQPFASANFLDLWSRWHISLSEWFKLYVFNPSVKELIAVANRPALTAYLGAVGYFVTFFLMGLWHGISLRFVLYGLCLGAGVSVNKLYQALILKRLGRPRYAALTRRPLYMAGARALAVSFFVLALGFLWIPGDTGPGLAWTAGGALVVLCVGLLVIAASAVKRIGVRIPLTRTMTIALCTAEAVAVLAYLLVGGPVPPLLYTYF